MNNLNPIIENCMYHKNEDVETKFIICRLSDFQQVKDRINSKYQPHINSAVEQMNNGIDFSFWYDEEGLIRFEG